MKHLLLVIFCTLFMSSISYALSEREVSKFYEDGITTKLGKYLELDTFYLKIKTVMNGASQANKDKDIPYLLDGNIEINLGEAIRKNKLKSVVRGLIVSLTLDRRHNKRTVAFVKTVVRDFIVDNGGPKYRLSIQRFDLATTKLKQNEEINRNQQKIQELESQSQQLAKQLDQKKQKASQAENSAETYRQKIDQLEQRLEDLKQGFTTERNKLDNELRDITNEKKDLQNKINELEKELNAVDDNTPIWKTNLGQIILATAFAFAVLCMSLILFKGTKVLSAVIERVGKLIVGSGKRDAVDAGTTGKTQEANVKEQANLASNSDEVRLTYVQQYKKAVNELFTEENFFVLVMFLAKELRSLQDVEKIVGIVELLGDENSKRILSQMPKHMLQRLSIVSADFVYERRKLEVFAEVYEDLATYLSLQKFSSFHFKLNRKLVFLISVTDITMLSQIVADLDQGELERFTHYLDASLLDNIMSCYGSLDEKPAMDLLAAVATTDKFNANTELDGQLAQRLETSIQSDSVNLNSLLSYYTSLFKNSRTVIRERVLEQLSSSNPSLYNQLIKMFPTFQSFFSLSGVDRQTILSQFHVKSLAVLVSGIQDETRRQLVISAIDSELIALVEDEFQLLGAKSAKERKMAWAEVTEKITRAISPEMLSYEEGTQSLDVAS